jgi:hypothetical protein
MTRLTALAPFALAPIMLALVGCSAETIGPGDPTAFAGADELSEVDVDEEHEADPEPAPDAPPPPPPPQLPPACPPGPSPIQSPPIFTGPGAITPAPAETCDPAGSGYVACHQHMHCPPEHAGAGTCDGAQCEVHTVLRKRKDGGMTAPVGDIHAGTVGGNCDPANHDLMVRGQFIKFGDGDAGPAGNITYCGSATGNGDDDNDPRDGRVTCAESGVNQVSVRWCIESQCIRGVADQAAAQAIYGHDEPTRDQGCPGPIPQCRAQGQVCRANYDPAWVTPDHCCAGAPACVVPQGATTGTCQPSADPPPPPIAQCVAPGGVCRWSWNPVSYSRDHCCSASPDCVYPFPGAASGTCRARIRPPAADHHQAH